MMATYAYQQNMFDGASEGYVKFNISPDLGTVVSAGTTITITGQAYHKSRANKCIEITTTASSTYRSAFVNVNIPKATVTNFTLKFQMWELSSDWGTSRVVNALINFTLWSGANCDGNGDGTFNTNSQAIRYLGTAPGAGDRLTLAVPMTGFSYPKIRLLCCQTYGIVPP